MRIKFLARCGDALLTSALVATLAVTTPALAQEPPANTEEGRLIVPLNGTGTVRRTADLSASPTRVDTGMVEIGDAETTTIALRHDGGAGDAPIGIGAATLIGRNADEYVSDFGGFRTLSPGESIGVEVTFTPYRPGTKSAALRVDIDGTTTPFVVLFDGRSRYPLTSDLGLSAEQVAFGQVFTGEGVTKRFVLENQGGEEGPPINVTGLQLGGDTPEAFLLDFVPTMLAPGEKLTVSATMSSGQPGTKAATVTVFHDGNNPSVATRLEGQVVEPQAIPVSFAQSTLQANAPVQRGTTIQFGPDGKLYVGEMTGAIHVFAVTRNGKNDYSANKLETINLVKNVPNHDDDGTPNPNEKERLLTGIHVTGTAAQPIIYAASSDPRQGAGPSPSDPDGKDVDLDTNSGIIHRLTKGGGGWVKQDLVRGLPRSEENHVPNGLTLVGDKLFVVTGGHTNQGLPSTNFAQLPEYALSGAFLEIDLGKINGTYDLPTLDDEDRAGTVDANDPFGGNDGKNQAKLVAGGPVAIYSTGLRNAYDVVRTTSGRFYTFDNGPNTNWGGTPTASCLNISDNGGTKLQDNLHLLTKGSYAGHPNPTRGNTANTFNASNPQSPVEIAADPVQCQYKAPGQDGSLTSINASTNGLDEYTASNFGGAMKGDLLAAGWNKKIYRIELNAAGDKVTSNGVLATGVGSTPLDLTAQDDGGPFPGTIWIVDNKEATIKVLEPADY